MRIESAQHVRSAFRREDFLKDDLPQVAFVGRSNVGKSSLLNRLLGRKSLARISSTPGRTRGINYFLVGTGFYFVDLPGYGYAKVAKSERRQWAEMMESFFRDSGERTLAIQLVDAKVGATDLDVRSFEYLESIGVQPTVVATRADRVPRSRRHRALNEIGRTLGLEEGQAAVAVSAKTGEGVKDVWREIWQFLTDEERGESDGADQGR